MGDFYEMFWEDAKLANKRAGRGADQPQQRLEADDAIPMAGVPFHAVEGYLRRMIAAGHKVAICEQTEDPALAKGLIKREVVRLMTPGTLTDDPLLDGRSDNYLAAVAFGVTKADGFRTALAWVELSTGACVAMSGNEGQVLDEIARLRPAEVLIPEHASGQPHEIAEAHRAAGHQGAITLRPGLAVHGASREGADRPAVAGDDGARGSGFADDDPARAGDGGDAELSGGDAEDRRWRTCGRCGGTVVEDHLWHRPGELAEPGDRPHGALRRHRGLAAVGHRPHAHQHGRRGCCGSGCASRCATSSTSRRGRARSRRCWNRRPACKHGRRRAGGGVRHRADHRPRGGGPREPARPGRAGHVPAALPELFDQLRGARQRREVAPELLALRGSAASRRSILDGAILPDPAPHLREGGVIADGFDPELDRLRDIGNNSQQWLAQYQAQAGRAKPASHR